MNDPPKHRFVRPAGIFNALNPSYHEGFFIGVGFYDYHLDISELKCKEHVIWSWLLIIVRSLQQTLQRTVISINEVY